MHASTLTKPIHSNCRPHKHDSIHHCPPFFINTQSLCFLWRLRLCGDLPRGDLDLDLLDRFGLKERVSMSPSKQPVWQDISVLNTLQYSPDKSTCSGGKKIGRLIQESTDPRYGQVNLFKLKISLTKAWKSWPLLIADWLICHSGCNEFHSNHC